MTWIPKSSEAESDESDEHKVGAVCLEGVRREYVRKSRKTVGESVRKSWKTATSEMTESWRGMKRKEMVE